MALGLHPVFSGPFRYGFPPNSNNGWSLQASGQLPLHICSVSLDGSVPQSFWEDSVSRNCLYQVLQSNALQQQRLLIGSGAVSASSTLWDFDVPAVGPSAVREPATLQSTVPELGNQDSECEREVVPETKITTDSDLSPLLNKHENCKRRNSVNAGGSATVPSNTMPKNKTAEVKSNGKNANSKKRRDAEDIQDIRLRFLISNHEAEMLLGPDSITLQLIRKTFQIKMAITRKREDCSDRLLLCRGEPKNLSSALAFVVGTLVDSIEPALRNKYQAYRFLKQWMGSPSEEKFPHVDDLSDVYTIHIVASNSQLSRVFGKNGAVLSSLHRRYDVKMLATREFLPDSDERILEIQGIAKSIAEAALHVGKILARRGNDIEYFNERYYYPHNPKRDAMNFNASALQRSKPSTAREQTQGHARPKSNSSSSVQVDNSDTNRDQRVNGARSKSYPPPARKGKTDTTMGQSDNDTGFKSTASAGQKHKAGAGKEQSNNNTGSKSNALPGQKDKASTGKEQSVNDTRSKLSRSSAQKSKVDATREHSDKDTGSKSDASLGQKDKERAGKGQSGNDSRSKLNSSPGQKCKADAMRGQPNNWTRAKSNASQLQKGKTDAKKEQFRNHIRSKSNSSPLQKGKADVKKEQSRNQVRSKSNTSSSQRGKGGTTKEQPANETGPESNTDLSDKGKADVTKQQLDSDRSKANGSPLQKGKSDLKKDRLHNHTRSKSNSSQTDRVEPVSTARTKKQSHNDSRSKVNSSSSQKSKTSRHIDESI
ncbi:uncharacterized protein KNAG_0J02400 [Huiozyma naganishii CBS 8797]|uniref:K Homology domain-containing protein n=1 Tax=Huiozyma naganishii (strain ATCC MYA-139 / BCRC 22969 / CBS 8797 / KCTC 17520 / NBRC 10181 / NCYC 3082 / Yp74L-3) TaxID=1071383 RepID=J7RBQ2_HUIN7|nr:hypothetical protein KNAG_0J02400 [Kazachstania naganishii CBS 8797]CCK72320.1 hypothetical protein KNAG_0J02400 [Kazachstania naganishii CBS 8797]